MEQRPGLLGKAEKLFGLPPLDKVAEGLGKFPDVKQLQLIKQVLEAAERVSKTGPELDKVLNIIREMNSMPVEKLDKIESVLEKIESMLKRIDGIIKKAPQEAVNLLKELITLLSA